MIVGLSGYARSGKDTVAGILVEKYGFRRVAFADKLKESVHRLDPLVDHGFRLSQARHLFDPDYLKDNFPEYRALLQRMGTEVGRELFGENFWVDIALNGISYDEKIVVTDCRFPNEAEAIKARGGQVWRINRKGFGPANQHPSETSLDGWGFDNLILNDGTIEYLEQLVGELWRGLV